MVRLLAAVLGLWILTGCGGGKLPGSDQASDHAHPEAQTTDAATNLGSSGPVDDHERPLKLTGLNSLEELQRAGSGEHDPEALEAFTSGFRKTFTADPARRDYPGAVADLERAIQIEPGFAEAHRALGYARFNQGFNVQGAMESYLKAVELDPEYGEAHYALAFMYAMNDRDRGADHFKKAMELGVADERGLAQKYYEGR